MSSVGFWVYQNLRDVYKKHPGPHCNLSDYICNISQACSCIVSLPLRTLSRVRVWASALCTFHMVSDFSMRILDLTRGAAEEGQQRRSRRREPAFSALVAPAKEPSPPVFPPAFSALGAPAKSGFQRVVASASDLRFAQVGAPTALRFLPSGPAFFSSSCICVYSPQDLRFPAAVAPANSALRTCVFQPWIGVNYRRSACVFFLRHCILFSAKRAAGLEAFLGGLFGLCLLKFFGQGRRRTSGNFGRADRSRSRRRVRATSKMAAPRVTASFAASTVIVSNKAKSARAISFLAWWTWTRHGDLARAGSMTDVKFVADGIAMVTDLDFLAEKRYGTDERQDQIVPAWRSSSGDKRRARLMAWRRDMLPCRGLTSLSRDPTPAWHRWTLSLYFSRALEAERDGEAMRLQ